MFFTKRIKKYLHKRVIRKYLHKSWLHVAVYNQKQKIRKCKIEFFSNKTVSQACLYFFIRQYA